MLLLIFIISLYSFIKSVSYAIFEIKTNQNIFGGTCIIILSSVILFLPSYMFLIR